MTTPEGNIPLGLCQCGCGRKTTISAQNVRRNGYTKGVPRRYLTGHHTKKNTPEYAVEDKGYKTPCWVWQRSVHCKTGYASKRLGTIDGGDGTTKMAHVVYWEAANGPKPVGMDLDHLCRVRRCVNPDHLEPVTHRENVMRGDLPRISRLRRKTHCKCGREYDGKTSNGWNSCSVCMREKRIKYALRPEVRKVNRDRQRAIRAAKKAAGL